MAHFNLSHLLDICALALQPLQKRYANPYFLASATLSDDWRTKPNDVDKN